MKKKRDLCKHVGPGDWTGARVIVLEDENTHGICRAVIVDGAPRTTNIPGTVLRLGIHGFKKIGRIAEYKYDETYRVMGGAITGLEFKGIAGRYYNWRAAQTHNLHKSIIGEITKTLAHLGEAYSIGKPIEVGSPYIELVSELQEEDIRTIGIVQKAMKLQTCPICGHAGAYIGLREVECANSGCRAYKPTNLSPSEMRWRSFVD